MQPLNPNPSTFNYFSTLSPPPSPFDIPNSTVFNILKTHNFALKRFAHMFFFILKLLYENLFHYTKNWKISIDQWLPEKQPNLQ